MNRVRRMALASAIVLGLGGGAALYTFVHDLKTRDDRRAAEFEASRVFHFGRDHVLRATLYARGSTLTFERGPSERFTITSPFRWPADEAVLRRAFDQMAALRYRTIVHEVASTADLESVGLEPPKTELKVFTTRGEFGIRFGARNPIAGAYPATDQSRQRIGLVEDTVVEAIDRESSAFREKRPFPFDPKDVVAIEIDHEDVRFRLERAPRAVREDEGRPDEAPGNGGPDHGARLDDERGGGWGDAWLIDDTTRRTTADREAVGRLLVALTRRLETKAFVTDQLAPNGEGGPARARIAHVTLELADGATPGATLAREPGSANPDGPRWLHVEGTATLLEVPSWIEEELFRTAEDFDDRTIARFEESEVKEVEIAVRGRESIVVERFEGSGDGGSRDGWRMIRPEEAPLKAWKMDALIRTFSRLKAERIHRASASLAELAEWRLNPPEREITFRDRHRDVLASVRIGHLEDERTRFATRADSARVGLVAESKVATIPTSAHELIDQDQGPSSDR